MAKDITEKLKIWRVKVENDLQTIENEFSAGKPVLDTICFHSQQAVEKCLKMYLVSRDKEPEKIHNIAVLLRQCAVLDPSFDSLAGIEYLTDYAVFLRYPDNFYIPTLAEARKAADWAKKTGIFVFSKLR